MLLNSAQNSIHLTLKKLIKSKAERDNCKFTAAQLAQALGMPRSIITKLTHPDSSKRVNNPRIDTLIKIVDFFRADGFQISLDDLIGTKQSVVDVKSIQNPTYQYVYDIAVFSLENQNLKKIGEIDVKLDAHSRNSFGLRVEKEIWPFLKSGSIIIINPDLPLENNHLIALFDTNSNDLLIKKYFVEKNSIVLKSLNPLEKDIKLMPTFSCKILGVITQANIKT